MKSVYHLAVAERWKRYASSDFYEPDAFARDGFIHCCTSAQLSGVASRYYKGASDLVLLVIDRDRLQSELVFENTLGGSELFPHLYGPLNCDAVTQSHHFAVTQDGEFVPSLEQMRL